MSDGDFKADDTILTFSEPGPRHFLYRVDVLDDAIAEGSEELFVNLSAGGGPEDKGVAFHRNAAQLSIVDNDSKTIMKIQLIVPNHIIYHLQRVRPLVFQGPATLTYIIMWLRL